MKIFKKGFTLAEVLITLTIIGIVAATTLPSLNANVNDRALATQAKKAYSTLSNAMPIYLANNGAEDINSLTYGATQAKDFVENYLKPISSNASFTNNTGNVTSCSRYTLNDSSEICIGTSKTGSGDTAYITVFVDTNGIKGPNKNGKDFFKLAILNDGRVDDFYFAGKTKATALGTTAATLKTTCNNGSSLTGCFGYLMRNGFDFDK